MRISRFLIVLAIGMTVNSGLTAQSTIVKDQQWYCYGKDAGGSRYADLKQVNDKNVKNLKVAWQFQTGELKTYTGTNLASKSAFEATPIMVNGTLYFATPTSRIFALDAETGQQKWMYDPGINLKGDYSEVTSRGVSTWPAENDNKNANAERRIYAATIDGRLICLKAANGLPATDFGNNGTVDLKTGIGRDLSVTSPPAIIGNLVVVGSSFGDNQRFDYPRGTVRAYDAITGKLAWSWSPIPADSTDPAWSTWNGTKAHKTGAANAWSVISADPARDMVFIPTTSPSPDYYGGERIGSNLYGNCLVALQASTGKLLWYYQVVHHDLWDYDIAAQPMLITVKQKGKAVPAVAVGTKMGFVFILHRETGRPLFPVEERAVPASDVPGETAWPTQPFPVWPKPLGIQQISPADAWGLTPQDKELAQKRIAQYINKGIYTPPSYQGSIMTPGNIGGIHWGGMCYDPVKGFLVTNINRAPAIIRMIPRDEVAKLEQQDKDLVRAETGRQYGTPYIMKRDYLFLVTGDGMQIQSQPPWGTLLAIDLKNGHQQWEKPLGYMLNPAKFPEAKSWGSINLGGAITTAGNLVFVAATLDNYFRAFHTTTGELLWEFELPASAQATPMSYSIKGKQYIVIAAGGHGKLATKMGDYVMAFAVDQ